jgi:Zn-finger nucleic acid-binding protein
MTSRAEVEIDYCPECRGVWLDRGELDKIIERASRDDDDDHRRRAYESQQQFGRAPDPRSDYRYKKRKSFWTELFD